MYGRERSPPIPHHPEPFYRSARKAWFLQLGKRQIKLHADEKEARKRYHEIMASQEEPEPPKPVDASLAVVVIDSFLDWVQRHKAVRTYEWYQRHCEAFARSIPSTLPVSQLKPLHLTRICDSHLDWSPTTKHGLCRAVQRAFNWAVRQGMIERSPLSAVEKPEPQDRDVTIMPDEYEKIIGLVKGGFRDLLMMAWESGARPQELRVIEARHLDFENCRIVFPVKESKGKKLPRVVYFTDEAKELAKRLAEQHPSGPIFRNADGAPWTRFAINCAFIRLQKKLGRKLHLGAFRKSWATEALKNGVDVITTSHLLGHTNPAMLAKVYAKAQADPQFMAAMAQKARGAKGVK